MIKTITCITISALSLIVFITSCSKKKDNSSGSTFVIGNVTDFMVVNTFDTSINIIAPSQDDSQYQFDINDDGIFDFEFLSEHVLSSGGLNYRESSIQILNETIQISMIEMIDTTHECISILNDTSIIWSFIYNNYANATCQEDGIDSILSIQSLSYPNINSKGDSIYFTESWSSGTQILSYYDNSNNGISNSYKILRGNWNNSNMKYILFRIRKNSRYYYGWLKLSVNDYKEIRFYEYAYEIDE